MKYILNEIKKKRIFQLSKEELEYLYFKMNKSQNDIAKLLNTDNSCVSRKFKKENIKPINKNKLISTKQLQSNVEITEDLLKIEYPNNSITKIANKYNVSYSFIYKKLKEFKIPIEKKGFFQKKYVDGMTYNSLFDLYWIKELSLNEIGELYNVDKNYIKRRFKDFNIKIRSKKEAFNLKKYKAKKRNNLIILIGDDLTKFKPLYNKKSIKIIEEFGKTNGYIFQHAENEGEFFIDKLFYWVDGYDIKNNIVVEYYENQHKYKLEYDKKRIEKIKKHLNCIIYIIHENGNIEKH